MDYYSEKMQHTGLGFREYVQALEQERSKIQVFQRELPLCLELITQAIETCRQQLSGTTTENNLHGQSESSEQTTSNEAPVFEEFIPLKRPSLSDEDEDEDEDDDNDDEQESHKAKREKSVDNKRKSDWLRSAGLWNTTSDPPLKEDVPRKASVMEVKRNGGAFQPFHREKSVVKPISAEAPAPAVAVAAMSSSAETETGGSGRREDKDAQNQRKQRRNWSPELHKRFLHALQQLGGPHAATPKQIRELMKVDGLTNDEVKSHLQKFRLHTRRPSPTIHHNNGNPQTPQYVVVFGVQPSEYGAVAATTASGEVANLGAPNGIYAPVASPPAASPPARMEQKQSEHSQSEERVSRSEGSTRSNSPATSSSTHNTTTSPMF